MIPSRHNSIQWLRAIAAVEVVLWHSDLATKQFSTFSIQHYEWYKPLGGIGVELFFIVSGYLMYLTAPRYKSGAAFIYARIARIVPMYWIFTSLVVFAFLINPQWRLGNFTLDGATLFRSYMIIPQLDYPILNVGWTLEHEMIFYVGLALLMGVCGTFPKWPVMIALVFAGMAGLALGTGGLHPRLWDFHLFSPYMLCFGFGWGMSYATAAGPRATFVATIVAVAGALVAVFVADPFGDYLVARMLLAGTCFMLALILRRVLEAPLRINRIASAVADASYSLYLSHWLFLSCIGKALGQLHLVPSADGPIRLMSTGACIVASLLLFRYLERPIDRILRARKRDSATTGVVPPVSAALPTSLIAKPQPLRRRAF